MTADPSETPEGGRRPLWVSDVGIRRRLALLAISFGFYLLLGDRSLYGILTGIVTAILVTVLLDHVAFREAPTIRRTVPRLVRGAVFVPLLCWEILKANVAIAYVILHPRLPIDPSFERFEPATESDLERAVLATSITLTPGTLTTDVDGDAFEIHALTRSARDDLLAGALPAAVSRVFHGRRSQGQMTDADELSRDVTDTPNGDREMD